MMAFMDNETGEIVMNSHLMECNLDVETGECVGNESEPEMEPKSGSALRKTKFNVPKSYLVQSEPKTKDKCCLKSRETYSLTSKERVMELKEVNMVSGRWNPFHITIRTFPLQKIILGYNKTSHRLFLIPSLFFFPRIAAIILMITEISLHVWSHSKNMRNANPKIYYRSPLHALTSQFCSMCLDTKDLHNERYHKKKKVVTSSLQ